MAAHFAMFVECVGLPSLSRLARQEVAFRVQSGGRTFTWTYNKDSCTAGGEDTAWVDDITFVR